MRDEPEVRCPAPETLAAFAEGRLRGTAARAVVEHLDRCESCMSDVALAMRAASQERGLQKPQLTIRLLAVAAAVLVLLVAVPAIRNARRDPMERLVALAPRSARAVEPRLTGGFPWAGYQGPARTADEATDAQRLKLDGVAGELVERAERDGTASAQHAAGVAMVLLEKPGSGIGRLEAAARASNDAKTWSDLAAARYAAALELGRASLLPEALAAADQALRIDAALPEALFNRALILQKMGLAPEARRAWEQYLHVDGTSPWAVEARARLARLPASTPSSELGREQPRLESAGAAGDRERVRALVDRHREQARALAEAEYLGRWGEAVQRNDPAAAAHWLAVSHAVGEALMVLSGDSLLGEAVDAIETAGEADRATIAEAHVRYRQGRIAYSRGRIGAAERELRKAAAEFGRAGDPMAFAAGYYAAGARLAQNDVAGARAELEQIRAVADSHPGMLTLQARARWELARAHMIEDDWAGAVPLLEQGAALFGRAGERANEAAVQMMLANALASLGRADEAWTARLRAFAGMSGEADERLAAATASASRAELRAGRRDAALALLNVQQSLLRDQDSVLRVETLVAKAVVEALAGRAEEARRTAGDAERVAARLPDAPLRARELADVAVAAGAALLPSDPRAAAASLTRSIDFYRAHGFAFALPEPLLLRARCALRTGDAEAAARDLTDGIAVVALHPPTFAGVLSGTGALDAANALHGEAIALDLRRGHAAAAFEKAERWHGGELTVAELQRRLAGSGSAVLEIVALPNELVTFAVAEEGLAVARSARRADQLPRLAEESRGTAAGALYDDVIRPLESIVNRAQSLVIVADRRLEGASFAALYDRRTHTRLVERMPVAIASSAASLGKAAKGSASSVAVVALPKGVARALPDLEDEIAAVAGAYRQATALSGGDATFDALLRAATRASVVHIAGHTEHQPGGGEPALVFAGAETVSWKAVVSARPIRADVVVLAACETLRSPASAETDGLSLGGAFAAAGVKDVIGTLAPIGDQSARMLFASVHRHLARGASASEAVRRAQLEAIAGGWPAWQSLTVLTRRIPEPSKERGPWAN